jgi:manganese transport protein
MEAASDSTQAFTPESVSIRSSPGRRLMKWLGPLGPGMITAALVFGPSKITITSRMGAEYGFSLLWIVAVAIFFMMIFTSMAGRIGMATDQSFLTTIRNKWGKATAIVTGLGVFMVTASFQAGNSIGVGIAVAELFNTPTVPWIIAFNLFGISLLFFRSFYKALERIMISLIGLMLFAFLITLFLTKPSIKEITGGLVPFIPRGSGGLLIAFMASCFSIVGACYQSYLVQERRRVRTETARAKDASVPGILMLGLMSAMVMVCAAVVLNPKGIHLNTASDMSKALEPSFGRYASTLFLLGLFGAAFSSLVGNASVGGTLMSDALGYGSRFSSKVTRLLIASVMVIGAAISVAFGGLPLELIIFAQKITILVVPFIGIAMLIIANDGSIMGKLRNTIRTRIFAGVGLLLLLGLAALNVKTLFLR